MKIPILGRGGGWWLVVGGWWLVVGGWWLVVGGWWLVVGGWWLVVGGWWLSISWQKNSKWKYFSRWYDGPYELYGLATYALDGGGDK